MELLETSIKALEIAKLVTAQIPVPGLSTAVECALSIAKKAKDIKDTRDDCRALAERVATLVVAVYQQLKHGSSDTEVKEHVETFLQNLQAIENLMDRRLRPRKRDRLLFALKRGKIADEVKTLTTKLEDCFRSFMIQTALAINQDMNTLRSGNVRMLQYIDDSARVGEVVLGDTRVIRTGLSDLAQRVRGSATFDGNFRLFARENLTLLEPIVDSHNPDHTTSMPDGGERTLIQTVAQPRTGRVFRYRAIVKAAGELSGTQVVVHTYPNRGDQRFVEAVKLAKQAYHPHILDMLGYSRCGDAGEAAYIVTEHYISFGEYLSSYRGTSKLRVLIRASAEISMAIDYLDTQVELRSLFLTGGYLHSRTEVYHIGSDEVVFHHRHGGRIKWARDPIAPEKADNLQRMVVPTAQRDRMRLIEDFRAVASASADALVQYWLSLILGPIGEHRDFLIGRLRWQCWDHIVHYPLYPLGVWLGRNSSGEYWTRLSARNPGYEVAITMQNEPIVLPGRRQDGRAYWQRLSMFKWFEVPESDLGEMCVEFELGTGRGQTKWKRYQFSCIPVNKTLLFRQDVQALDKLATASWMMRALPDPSVVGLYTHIEMAIHRAYITETTISMSAHTAEQVVRSLWFFVLQFDGGAGSVHDCNIPSGFWSSEKYPTSVPAGIIFDSTPQSEPIMKGVKAPLFTWAQVLGNLVFTTETKMYTEVAELTEDKLFALREFQDRHYANSDTDGGDSDDSGRDGVATDDSDEDDAGDSDAGSLASSSSNDDHAPGVNNESPDSDCQDTTDAGYDSADS